MTRGRIVKRACENELNVIGIGRAHENPILDTKKYVVDFETGEEAELSANAIAQSMHAQCDPKGSRIFYLILL